MSSYWQGKGAGKRIAIRFNKPLLGDVTGNEMAFTVKGMVRNPLKYGPLTERTFTVESVERYPLTVFWEDDFSGQMDGVEVGANGVVLESEIGQGTEYAVDTELLSSGQTLWAEQQVFINKKTYLYGVSTVSRVSGNHVLKLLDSNKNTIKQGSVSGTGYLSIDFEEALPVEVSEEFFVRVEYPSASNVFRLPSALFPFVTDLWTSGIMTFPTGTFNNVLSVGLIEGDLFFEESGTYTTTIPTATLPADPRIRIEANTPEDTSITVEYACTADDEPDSEDWAEITDGDLLTITADTLWLRYTLTTDNPAVTPTLLSAWLEESDAPPGTILLTMTPDSRFNDVEGDLTISYEREKGTLTGTRPVEDFTESFTPTGLEPTPLNVQGTITAGIEVAVDLIKVDYIDLGHKHIITAGITVEVDLIPASEIPP